MIPKTIHYCWFGKGEKPQLAIKCIESWKKYCPDYEIKEWNEENFNINKAPLYVKQAYDTKKYAFVSDYVRLYVLYNYGGIYMDTDVEVIQPLDKLLEYKAVSGFEDGKNISTSLIGSESKHPIIKDLLNFYNNISFFKENGTIDTTTNVRTITKTFIKYGLIQNNKFQTIQDFTILPKDYLCPKDYYTDKIKLTNNTLTIHHFAMSWGKEETKFEKFKRNHPTIDYIIHLPNLICFKLLGSKYDKLKKVLKKCH